MKRTLAVLAAMILVLQMIPFEAIADAAVTIREAQSVVTVSFGGDEYIFADGHTMETLPEAEERERYLFDGWYDGWPCWPRASALCRSCSSEGGIRKKRPEDSNDQRHIKALGAEQDPPPRVF